MRVIFRSRRARRQIRAVEPINITRSIVSKFSGVIAPVIATGRARTIQMLKILLPTIFPTRRSDSPFFAAVIVVTNSGREVPIATIEREIIRSEIPIAVAIDEAELTTSWLPATTPARPTKTSRKDFPSLYLGFSTLLASFLFL